MAKISARGATAIEKIESVIHTPAVEIQGVHLESFDTRYTHTLCSDGRILRKADAGSYRKVAQIKAHVPDPVATFRAYVARFVAARS